MKKNLTPMVLAGIGALLVLKAMLHYFLPDQIVSLYYLDPPTEIVGKLTMFIGTYNLFFGLFFLLISMTLRKFSKIALFLFSLMQFTFLINIYIYREIGQSSIQMAESLIFLFIGILSLLFDYRNQLQK